MKVCFAVQKDDGVESVVYGHFGSAPAFIVVDTDIDFSEQARGNLSSEHGEREGEAPGALPQEGATRVPLIAKMVTVSNRDLNHAHGACNPIQAIGGLKPDAVVVGGIGAGAVTRLNAEGVKVYRAAAETVQQNLDLLRESKLPELSVQNACAGHTQGQGGCGH